MTPEQLEAHRMRFEAAYGRAYLLSGEEMKHFRCLGLPDYVSTKMSKTWQAYQWALADTAQPPQQSAQPVEVQPLTNAQVSEGQDSNGLFPGSAASCAFTMGVRFAESKHGIKPTSSEGGA